MQPNSGGGPIAFCRRHRNAQRRGCLFEGHPHKKPQLDELSLPRRFGFQHGEGLMNGKNPLGLLASDWIGLSFIDVEAHPVAALAFGSLAPRLIHENPSHGFCGCGKEVPPRIPMLDLVYIDETKVGIVDQCCRLQSLPRVLMSQFSCRKLSQFIIDQRQEPLGSDGIALLNLRQNAGDVGH